MTDEFKLPRLARDFAPKDVKLATSDDGTRISFSLSSETPVERFFGQEVLAHEAGAIRLGRFSDGAGPLLWNHNWDDPIGMVDAARIDAGRLVVDAHLFETTRAKEIKAMLDGGLRNVSVGYEIHQIEVDDQRNVYRAIDWEPLEASIVTVPADASVGIGRAGDSASKPVRITRKHSPASAANPEGHIMSDEKTAAADTTADTKSHSSHKETRQEQPRVEMGHDYSGPDAIELEKNRKTAIQKLSRANHIDSRVEEHWIKTGARLEQVSDELVKILEERSTHADLPAMIGMEKKEVRRYSLLRALRAAQNKDWTKAGLELEAHRAIMNRDGINPRSDASFYVPLDVQMRNKRDLTDTDFMAIGTGGTPSSTGAKIVPDTYLAGSFIEMLRNQSVVMSLGATRLSNLTGNITIPRQTGSSTAYWLADENAQITQSQPSFGQLTLTPKNVAAVTEISHQLITQSDPSVEQLVMSDLSRVLALAADIAALRGSGADGQPQGIVGSSGIGSFTMSGTPAAAMDYAGLVQAQTDLFTANALSPGCAYVGDSGAASALMGRSRFANTDTPLWDGSLFSGNVAGFPARASNQMEASTLLFGLWSSLVIAEWGVLEIMTNPFSDFTRGLSSIRAWYTMDVGLRYPSAFTYATDVS
jgi:HK97 family phage major capsid protein/HK97 family phage prohead protease